MVACNGPSQPRHTIRSRMAHKLAVFAAWSRIAPSAPCAAPSARCSTADPPPKRTQQNTPSAREYCRSTNNQQPCPRHQPCTPHIHAPYTHNVPHMGMSDSPRVRQMAHRIHKVSASVGMQWRAEGGEAWVRQRACIVCYHADRRRAPVLHNQPRPHGARRAPWRAGCLSAGAQEGPPHCIRPHMLKGMASAAARQQPAKPGRSGGSSRRGAGGARQHQITIDVDSLGAAVQQLRQPEPPPPAAAATATTPVPSSAALLYSHGRRHMGHFCSALDASHF